MTVVLEYRSGKTEIVQFIYRGHYPERVRLRRVVGVDRHSEPQYSAQVFHRDRWLRTGNPVYVEEQPAEPQDVA